MINPEQQLKENALRVNFDERQQVYFDRLMSELEVISQGKGFSELEKDALSGTAVALQRLREYISKKEQIVEFIENKEISPVFVNKIEATTPDGEWVEIHLQVVLESWKEAYKQAGVDWIELPDRLEVPEQQAERMQELIAKYGFDKVILIPDQINGNNEFEDNKNYELTNQLLDGVDNITTTSRYRGAGGSISRVRDKRQGLRIVLMKKSESMDKSQLYIQTMGARYDKVQKTEPFQEPEISGLTLSEFAVWQWMHYNATSKFWGGPDEIGLWLPESEFDTEDYQMPIALIKKGREKISFISRPPDGGFSNAGTLFGAVFPIE